ncbi:hypothetical protein GNE01_11045 [Klebsiella sp. JL973]|nr:hypothetical protein [Klebsiella sp. JL973]
MPGLGLTPQALNCACRAGPEGVSRRAANNRTPFDGVSGRRKAKTQP